MVFTKKVLLTTAAVLAISTSGASAQGAGAQASAQASAQAISSVPQGGWVPKTNCMPSAGASASAKADASANSMGGGGGAGEVGCSEL